MYTAPRSPQSIGGVIDSSINLFKASFRHCWQASLLSALVSVFITVWLQLRLLALASAAAASGNTASTVAAATAVFSSPSIWIAYLALIAVALAVNLMITMTINEVAAGRGSNALSNLKSGFTLLPGAVLVTIVLIVPVIVGFILLVVPGIYLIGRWCLWAAAYTEQRGRAFEALGRSWALVGGNWWRTFIVLSVIGVVAAVVLFVIGAVWGYIAAAIGLAPATRVIVQQALQGFTSVVYTPAFAAAIVAIYQDLKLRKGGADIEARLGGIEAPQA
ncbi:MAG: hypothetical protein WDO12_11475 [Pseudomonadota bacterium]